MSIPTVAYSARNLAQHLAQFHSPYQTYASRLFTCSRSGCKATFQFKFHKTAHERVHDNNLFRCVMCPYGTAQYDKLLIHQRLHFNARDFACDICGTGFTTVTSRREHVERIHRRETIKCPLCTYASERYSVGNHLRQVHKIKGIKWNAKDQLYTLPDQMKEI